MKIRFKQQKFEIDEKELGKLVGKEYDRLMKEEEKEGIISLDMGLFGLTDGYHGSTKAKGIPNCFACGSFEDYTGQCGYDSEVKSIKEDGRELSFCKKNDVPLKKLIERGEINAYELKGGG